MKKKLYIKTYGCNANVYDSIKMREFLEPHGYESIGSPDGADLIIVNTCHIREKATEKLYSELGRLKAGFGKIKPIVCVAGCVAQAEGEEICKRAPVVDIVVGPQALHNLPVLLEKVRRTNKVAIDLDFDTDRKFDEIKVEGINQSVVALLSIQEGCDKFCHFCVVPYTRGPELSRSVDSVYREAISLVSSGTKEIMLLGQNVSAYHGKLDGEEMNIGQLISHLCRIGNLKRVRYSTSHPVDMLSSGLIKAHKSEEKLMPYLHLPIQSGSDKILRSMNRHYTFDEYMDIIARFREARPDIAFSSDFIVGYPGETEEDFEKTLEVVRLVKYSHGYYFKYSPRPGTPGAMLPQVSEDVKTKRIVKLQEVVQNEQLEFNSNSVGNTLSVLLEKPGRDPGQLSGRSEYMQAVNVEADESLLGQIVSVQVVSASQNSVRAELVDGEFTEEAYRAAA